MSGRTPEHAVRYARHLRALVPLDGPDMALRLAFYLGGLGCFGVAPVCKHLHLPPNSLVMSASLIAGLISFFLACRSTVPHLLGWLLPYGRGLAICGLVGALWLSFYSLDDIVHFPRDLGRPNHSWTDAIAMTDCAAHLALRGRNPYADVSLVGCFSSLHLDGRFSTPLQAGAFAHVRVHLALQDELRAFERARRRHVRHPAEFASYFNYPAGSFLLAASVVALGWPELSASYMAWIVAAYVLLAWRAPARLRPWLVLLALANVAFWDYVIQGFTEGSMVFLLLAAWISRRRAVVSAALLGVAVATHQEAWTFALFYLVWSGRTGGGRAAVRRLAVIAAVFGLLNGPFALWSPGDWVNGVLGPLKDPMLPAGPGLIALGTTGRLPLWPRPVYSALELAALAACLVYYARTCRLQPDTGLVLALVPLVFAWRSFFVYFFAPLPVLCLWPLIADLRRTEAREGGGHSSVMAYYPEARVGIGREVGDRGGKRKMQLYRATRVALMRTHPRATLIPRWGTARWANALVQGVRARQRPPMPVWRPERVSPDDIMARWSWIAQVMIRPDHTVDFARRDREIERLIADVEADPEWTVMRQDACRVMLQHRRGPIRLVGDWGGGDSGSVPYMALGRQDEI